MPEYKEHYKERIVFIPSFSLFKPFAKVTKAKTVLKAKNVYMKIIFRNYVGICS